MLGNDRAPCLSRNDRAPTQTIHNKYYAPFLHPLKASPKSRRWDRAAHPKILVRRRAPQNLGWLVGWVGVPTKKSQRFRAFARFFITWASLSNSGLTKYSICSKIEREKKKSRFFLSNILKLLKKSWLGGVVTIHPTITGGRG